MHGFQLPKWILGLEVVWDKVNPPELSEYREYSDLVKHNSNWHLPTSSLNPPVLQKGYSAHSSLAPFLF